MKGIIYYTTKDNKNVLNVIINAIHVTFGKIMSLCVIYPLIYML